MFYLSDVSLGGRTIFPQAGISVKVKKNLLKILKLRNLFLKLFPKSSQWIKMKLSLSNKKSLEILKILKF